MSIRYVYVAGPLSQGDQLLNIRVAIEAGDALMSYGFVPFVPHLTALWHMITPHDYETWMRYDDVWLQKCDAVLRIQGESAGADREVVPAPGNSVSPDRRHAFAYLLKDWGKATRNKDAVAHAETLLSPDWRRP